MSGWLTSDVTDTQCVHIQTGRPFQPIKRETDESIRLSVSFHTQMNKNNYLTSLQTSQFNCLDEMSYLALGTDKKGRLLKRNIGCLIGMHQQLILL